MSIIRKKMKGTHLVSYPYSFLDVSSVLKMFFYDVCWFINKRNQLKEKGK